MAPQLEPNDSPSVLTIRIHHTKTTFTATFKSRWSEGSNLEPKCSCSRLDKLWIGSDRSGPNSSRHYLLPDTPHDTTILRFVVRSAANTQKAKDICSGSQKSTGLEHFRKHMRTTLTALAAVCQGDHISVQGIRRPATKSPLLPFRTGNLDRKSVNEEVKTKMLTPLPLSAVQGQGLGYIYILRSQMDLVTLPVLKIGFSKYHPEHRAHELASCLPVTEVVGHTPLLPHARRVEALIHAELVAKRKILACHQCGQDHKEWFEISHAESREVVTRWSRWILRQPYLKGKLSDEWCVYLKGQDFEPTDPKSEVSEQWTEILQTPLGPDSDSSPEKELAAYVSACYFENIRHRTLGMDTGRGAEIRQTFRGGMSDGPIEIQDFQRALADFGSPSYQFTTAFDAELAACSEQSRPEPRRDFEAWKAQVFKEMEGIRNIRTGSMSVSDPVLGITESPMGDATLLPVVSLEVVRQMDAPARNWFGYTPTHQGFQLIQEAYQRGEWVGPRPQFKLPKAFRSAGWSRLSGEPGSGPKKSNASSSTQFGNGDNGPKNDQKAPESTGKSSGTPQGHTARFIRSADRDTWEFSAPMDDKFGKQVDEIMEVMKTPLGRALVEKEALRSLRHYGLPASGGYGDEVSLSSGESSSVESSADRMDIDEPEEVRRETSMPGRGLADQVPVSHSASQQQKSAGMGLSISKDQVRRWLDSF